MVIPTPSVLPDSTLAPSEVLQKFSSTTLAGLGVGLGDGCQPGFVDAYDPAYDEFYCVAQGSTVPASGPPPQGVNTDWGKLIADLTHQGIDVAKLAIVKPGTTQTAGGISRQNPGYPVLGGPGSQPVPTITGNLSNLVLFGGLGLMAMFMFSKRGQ